MAEEGLTCRQFVRETAAGAAALAVGASLPSVVQVGNAEQLDTRSILNYNSDMEYRRYGKTGWMVSLDSRNGPNWTGRWSRPGPISRTTTSG